MATVTVLECRKRGCDNQGGRWKVWARSAQHSSAGHLYRYEPGDLDCPGCGRPASEVPADDALPTWDPA